MNISAKNYEVNQLANNIIIDNCIRKCVEQLSQTPSENSVAKQTISKTTTNLNNENAARIEGNLNIPITRRSTIRQTVMGLE